MKLKTTVATLLVGACLTGTAAAQGDFCIPDPKPADVTVPFRANATIKDAAWLAGFWVGSAGTSTVEERWTPPAGGSMLALSRTVGNDKLTAFEFLCIIERDGGLVYSAMPNGRTPPTDFVLTRVEPGSLTFENPAHDFPKKIRYTRRSDGSLEAMISGAAGVRAQTFLFTRRE